MDLLVISRASYPAGHSPTLVTRRGAHFDRLVADPGQLLEGAGKVFAQGFAYGVGLAANRQAQRVGYERASAAGRGGGAEEILLERSITVTLFCMS